MLALTTNVRRLIPLVAALAASTAVAACSKKPANEQSSAGSIDTAVLNTTGATPAAGPAVQVTRTDSKSVDRAMRFKLTPDNFSRFMVAADSLVALEARDPTARAYLSNNLTDAGSTGEDAGLKWLESNDAISKAIEITDLSVEDYFVESIAIADAERFVSDPKAAPPTPTLSKNAKFLADHQTDLEHLKSLRDNKPGVTVTP